MPGSTPPFKLAAAACLFIATAAAARAGLWPLRSKDPLVRVAKLFASKDYSRVLGILTPEFIQKLKTADAARAAWFKAQSFSATGRPSRALSVYELASKLYPRNIRLHLGFADLLLRSDLPEKALPLYEKILKKTPDSFEARLGLARAEQALGFYGRSADDFKLALKDRSSARDPSIWRSYAEALYERGRLDDAQAAVEKALELRREAAGLIDLAYIERARGRLDGAIATLREARSLPDAPRALGRAITLWLLEARQPAQARAEAQSLLKADPLDPVALWAKAMADKELGRLREARRFMALAGSSPESAPFLAKVSKALLKTWSAP